MKHPGTNKGNDLAERLSRYAGEVLLVTAELPNTGDLLLNAKQREDLANPGLERLAKR